MIIAEVHDNIMRYFKLVSILHNFLSNNSSFMYTAEILI